jgi:GR25 family glycosyltransferase involved in LPS biosynthesis
MRIFVINCNGSEDRWNNYTDEKYERWEGTHWNELPENDLRFKKMVSYYNINPQEHKAKVGCLVSHTNLWRYIVCNKMNDILVLEDDAVQVRPLPQNLPTDAVTYLGGLSWNLKTLDGAKKISFSEGIYLVDGFKILMTMSYYLPTWEIAKELLDYVEDQKRWRAIDVMMTKSPITFYISYPASYEERGDQSLIRKTKKKRSNKFYQWV